MTDDEKTTGKTNVSESVTPLEKLVRCRRTGRDFRRSEHQKCPYCYGSADEIANGNHDSFCEYQPGVDPVCFGFPGTTSRERRG